MKIRWTKGSVALVALAALLLVGRLTIALRGDDSPVAAPPATVSAAPAPAASPTSPSTSPVSPSASPSPVASAVEESGPHEDMDPVAAAEAWVTAWLDTSHGKARWLAGLQPLTEPGLYAGFTQTDIERIPQGKVQPGTAVLPVEGRADVIAHVPTTVGPVLVTMTVQHERLIVTSNDWAPDVNAPGATA